MAMALVLMPGCVGTFAARQYGGQGADHSDGFGKYPYQAVANDIDVMENELPCAPTDGDMTLAYALFVIGLPFDFVADTIMLPVDLIGWPCGYKNFSSSDYRRRHKTDSGNGKPMNDCHPPAGGD
jgi:uncharacterized protein YceK